MYPRTNYEMTQKDLDAILDACKSVPLIMLQIPGLHRSRQERANAAWGALGKKMGFDHMTVQPTGNGDRFFTAIPSETELHRTERVAREDEEKKRAEVKRLEGVVEDAQAKLAALL